MLIFRYICREVMLVVSAIVLIMLIILLMGQATNYLGKIAHGAVAARFLAEFIVLNIPFLISYILPFAFYFGLLLAYGRFYADSEMVVLQASGFSTRRLFFYSMIPALLVMIIVAYLILILNPKLISMQGKLLESAKANILQTVIPGQFKSINNGKLILYVSKIANDKKHLQNVFVAQLDRLGKHSNENRWAVNFITSASQVVGDKGHSYLQTADGYQYRGVPGALDYSILKYKKYNYLIKDNSGSVKYDRLDGMRTSELMARTNDVNALSELEWRISLVLQVAILTLFAIPFSRIQPRQGRYAKFLPATLFYLLYINLIFIARSLLENQTINARLGLWWAHLVMLVIVLLYYAKTYRWFKMKE